MDRIAIVTIRYGKEINGGGELHSRMLAERLSEKYDVEILTTCVKDYLHGGNEFPEGTVIVNGVTVRRFLTENYDRSKERVWLKKAKPSRRFRQFLFKAGLLKPVSAIFPVWRWGLGYDINALRHSVFYSEDMVRFIKENRDSYKAIIAVTADYAPFFFTAIEAGEKMIAVPTLHNAKVSFRPALTLAFSRIRYTGFNTDTEQELAREIFGKALKESGIISVGIESPELCCWKEVKDRFSLPDRFILYVGRVSSEKTGKLFRYYGRYRREAGVKALPLVIVGQKINDFGTPEGVSFTGFVSDSEKRTIMKNSALLVNPSRYESLSLILLEALNDSVPVLVNGHCKVLKDHCRKSGMAVRYYTGYRSFRDEVISITQDAGKARYMKEKGKAYMEENYSWDKIMPRLYEAIDKVSGHGR